MVLQTPLCDSVERLCVRAHYDLKRDPDVEGVEVGEAERIQELDRGDAPLPVCPISTVVV